MRDTLFDKLRKHENDRKKRNKFFRLGNLEEITTLEGFDYAYNEGNAMLNCGEFYSNGEMYKLYMVEEFHGFINTMKLEPYVVVQKVGDSPKRSIRVSLVRPRFIKHSMTRVENLRMDDDTIDSLITELETKWFDYVGYYEYLLYKHFHLYKRYPVSVVKILSIMVDPPRYSDLRLRKSVLRIK